MDNGTAPYSKVSDVFRFLLPGLPTIKHLRNVPILLYILWQLVHAKLLGVLF